uniref:Uncharacterized protein n=1 Tax=Astyanax mexicanus TaxID=7994 RepID=A0A3B1JDJ6_ASTMX
CCGTLRLCSVQPRIIYSAGVQWHDSRLTATSASQVQVILLPQPPQVAGITGMCHLPS